MPASGIIFFVLYPNYNEKRLAKKSRFRLKKASNSFVKDQLVRENSDNSIVKPVYNNHNWEKNAVVERWSLFKGSLYYKSPKWDRYKQVVAILKLL